VSLAVRWVTVGPFQENSYLLVDEATKRAVLVDPGDEPIRITRMVREAGVVPEAIWLTHAHIDHIGAVAAMLREWDVPVHLHESDAPLWRAAPQQGAFYRIPFEPAPTPAGRIADGQSMRVGSVELTALHTPGHAPGHCVFVGAGVMIGGDLLFAGSIGRTDLPFADPAAMERSLERVASLAPETVVYPGHGPPTNIGEERDSNPFLNGMARVAGAAPR
jgi:glyoxylase-like metal-dependent hydrolase (beta-lactamase superfamily II)